MRNVQCAMKELSPNRQTQISGSLLVERPMKCAMELQASRRRVPSLILLAVATNPLAHAYILKHVGPTSRGSPWALAQVRSPVSCLLNLPP